ncbi:hypothetical protein FO440_10205 [Mucilaginibacter corticis]|uniref:Uncharacterized protein n=1 Tax=Mucilaginibacter corticis TaxID=2597670 RepID=A0A556MX59_9SPHI|nr:hypothetical protein [Mucilaginibacter corticis]TSJ44524.1 hypothetical protein FO440_10205 [Mucilaginibacter corticis]
MRILFILNNFWETDTIRNALADLAEKDSIYFVDSYFEAETFINKRIVDKQEPLDLIISQNKIGGEIALDFLNKLSAEPTRIYQIATLI